MSLSTEDKPISSLKRTLAQQKRKFLSPQFILIFILIIILGYLILVPLVNLVMETVVWGEGDVRFSPFAVPGEFTLEHWKRVITGGSARELLFEPLKNTMVVGASASILALLLGGILAWLVTRTDLPFRGVLRGFLILPYLLPSFALALSWTQIFKSSLVGGRPGFFEALTGITVPNWLSFGPIPLIITETIHYYPFTFLIVASALSTLDAQLEEGAELLGASRWKILQKITFPLVAPAFLSAWVLTLGKAVSAFAAPVLLGLPVRYQTLSTMLYSNIAMGFESNGYILALVLIIIASLTIFINTRVLGASAKFVTIGGKGFKANPVRLRGWRIPILIIILVMILAWVILPVGMIAYESFMLAPGDYSLDNFTSYFWVGETDLDIFPDGEPGVLANKSILSATWNSIRLSVSGALIGSLLGVLIGYLVVRTKNKRIGAFLDQIAFLPYLIPSIALGAMYLSLFSERRGPVPALYGTFALLVLATVIKRLPYSVRTGSSAVTQIGLELEEAAELQGASWFTRFRKIVLPLASSGIVSGMMLTYITMMRELSLIIILITPATRVLMTMSYRYVEEDYLQHSNALTLIVIVLTLIGEVIAWRMGKGKLASQH